MPVATLATKACNTSALNSVAPVMVMLLMGMGVGSVLLDAGGASTPVWGKVVLVCGTAGLTTTASRETVPALGGV